MNTYNTFTPKYKGYTGIEDAFPALSRQLPYEHPFPDPYNPLPTDSYFEETTIRGVCKIDHSTQFRDKSLRLTDRTMSTMKTYNTLTPDTTPEYVGYTETEDDFPALSRPLQYTRPYSDPYYPLPTEGYLEEKTVESVCKIEHSRQSTDNMEDKKTAILFIHFQNEITSKVGLKKSLRFSRISSSSWVIQWTWAES